MLTIPRRALLVALTCSLAVPAAAQSVFTTRIDDPAAVYLTPEAFGARGDGLADDSGPLQAAIDKAAATPNGGIVFLPSGRYRTTRTIFVWRAVRVFGYGATRPVLVLGPNTPGYQKGIGLMVMFTNAPRPPGGAGGPAPAAARVPFPAPGIVPPRDDISDASQVTFYPAISNVDVEIGDGNPAAVGIRFHVAQHGYLSHMHFRIGSGLAGLMQVGNEIHDVRFSGGRYGILTENTTPYWPFTILDATFEGQRDAAIREHTASLTLVRVTFRRVPVAIEIDKDYVDQLWVKDSRFEDVSTAIVISREKNAMMQVGVENAVCRNVAVFARFRESGKTLAAPGPIYRVADFNHGLFVTGTNTVGRIDTRFSAQPLDAMPAVLPPAIAPLPPTSEWVNVRTLGVAGTGKVDDTEAIKKAVASHRVLYFPTGYYIVRDTIALEPDTIIIGLHSALTQFDLADGSPGFDGVGPPKAMLQTPKGGRNIVSGIGIFTGAANLRTTGILWMAGEQSLLKDIQFIGGTGAFFPADVRAAFYPAPPAGRGGGPGGGPGAAPGSRLGAQQPSLWVTNGGGGSFLDIWSADSHAQGGFYVSDTTTPGHVYEVSVEHHLFNEIKLDRVENWSFHGPQTEEEAASSPESVALEINASRNITIANFRAYRVARSHAPFPAAIRVTNSSEIRFRNVHSNAEHGYGTCDENGCGTFLRAGKFPYANAVQDVTRRREVRERYFALLDLPSAGAPERPVNAAAVADAGVERLEGGFFSISGAAAGPDGTLYFADTHQHRIFSWSKTRGLEVVRHDPFDPVNLAVDRSGRLLVQSSAGREGTVYSFKPGDPTDTLTVLAPQPSAPRAGAMVAVPATFWLDSQFRDQIDLDTLEYKTIPQMFADEVTSPEAKEYVSPDGSLFLPAGRVFRQGANENYPGVDATGWRWSHNLGARGFVTALPGKRIYVSSGAENRTYRATVQANGTLGEIQPFAERGSESAVEDSAGNVYIANGQIFVYDRSGNPAGRIDVPERPIQLVFGGPDRRTLFILGHHTLYAVRTKVPGAALTDAPMSSR